MIVRMPPALASIQAGRSITRVIAVTGGSLQMGQLGDVVGGLRRGAVELADGVLGLAAGHGGRRRAEPLRRPRGDVPVDESPAMPPTLQTTSVSGCA